MAQPGRLRVLLGVTGGIAAYKAVFVLRALREAGHRVRVIPTAAALEFVGRPTWEALSGEPVTTSVFDGATEVDHVALGRSADLVVVAPAPAGARIQRMVSDRGVTREDAAARVANQASDEERLALADVVIDTSGTIDDTIRQADDLWERLRS